MLSLVLALAVATSVKPDACSWSKPGHDPYRSVHDMTVALSDFGLDPGDKAVIKSKMEAHRFDEVVVIKKDGIVGGVYTELRDMHSGHSTCRGPVTMKGWAPTDLQRALVYCGAGDRCVVVPLICNNVALVTRQQPVAKEEPTPLIVDETPIDIVPEAGPLLAPVEDRSFASVATSDDETSTRTYNGGSWSGSGGDGGGGGGIAYPPHPPSSGPGCGCVPPPPPVCPPPPISAVPEPSAHILYALGLIIVCGLGRRARNRRST